MRVKNHVPDISLDPAILREALSDSFRTHRNGAIRYLTCGHALGYDEVYDCQARRAPDQPRESSIEPQLVSVVGELTTRYRRREYRCVTAMPCPRGRSVNHNEVPLCDVGWVCEWPCENPLH